jgi:acyl-CoA synthetase (AMP-forming)/AMP-acid ligase II
VRDKRGYVYYSFTDDAPLPYRRPVIVAMSYSLLSGTVRDILRQRASTTPDAAYLEVSKDRAITYSEAQVLAESVIAENLKSRLPGDGTHQRRVAILAANGPLIPLTHWALWNVGGVPCPLSTTSEPKVWIAILEKLQPTAVIVSTALLERLRPVLSGSSIPRVPVIVLESLLPNLPTSASMSEIVDTCHRLLSSGSVAHPSAELNVAPSDVAFVLFTSSAVDSSTVKAVDMTHTMVLHDAYRMVKLAPHSYGDAPRRHLAWLPLGHAFELLCGL